MNGCGSPARAPRGEPRAMATSLLACPRGLVGARRAFHIDSQTDALRFRFGSRELTERPQFARKIAAFGRRAAQPLDSAAPLGNRLGHLINSAQLDAFGLRWARRKQVRNGLEA